MDGTRNMQNTPACADHFIAACSAQQHLQPGQALQQSTEQPCSPPGQAEWPAAMAAEAMAKGIPVIESTVIWAPGMQSAVPQLPAYPATQDMMADQSRLPAPIVDPALQHLQAEAADGPSSGIEPEQNTASGAALQRAFLHSAKPAGTDSQAGVSSSITDLWDFSDSGSGATPHLDLLNGISAIASGQPPTPSAQLPVSQQTGPGCSLTGPPSMQSVHGMEPSTPKL
jgi:hypothetical protein